MPAKGSGNYQAYLLRLWRDSPAVPWRASLESVPNGEIVAFSSMRDLVHFLGKQMEGMVAEEERAEAPLNEDSP